MLAKSLNICARARRILRNIPWQFRQILPLTAGVGSPFGYVLQTKFTHELHRPVVRSPNSILWMFDPGSQPRAESTSITKLIAVHFPGCRRDIRWLRWQVLPLATIVREPFSLVFEFEIMDKLCGLIVG